MKYSVAICTWNRSALLHDALVSICTAMEKTDAQWEVVVVNNNSTDRTDEVIASYRDQLPIVSVFEPKPGIASARNAAVEAASGDYIVWTDDDVRVDEEWLVSYERAFVKWPDVSFFGGIIRPIFEGVPPAWLTAAYALVDIAYAARYLDWAEELITQDSNRLPFGANMAIRTPEQRLHRFDTTLGRRPGTRIIGGEEEDVLRRILEGGGTGRWLRPSTVAHWIPKHRQTSEYLRAYYKGLGWVRGKKQVEVGRSLGGMPQLLSKSVMRECAYQISRVIAGPETRVSALIEASVAWGVLASTRSGPPRSDDPANQTGQ